MARQRHSTRPRSPVTPLAEGAWLGQPRAALRHLSKLMSADVIGIDSGRRIRHIPDRSIAFRPPEAKVFLVCHIVGGTDQESPAPAKACQEQAFGFPGYIGD